MMDKTHPVTEVVAAVLLRQTAGDQKTKEEFLLACRPSGKVYAGYWEFPGGKVEPGETEKEALIRELQEELGIAVTKAVPWICRTFVYPHAHVRLSFWRVSAWEGEIGVSAPLEHSAVSWQPLDLPPGFLPISPILPANGPILKALSLPCRMMITHAEQNGIPAELERLKTSLDKGIRLILLRDRSLPPALRRSFARDLMALAKTYQARLIVSVESEKKAQEVSMRLARNIGADGLHLTAAALAKCTCRPDFYWVGASCHNDKELRQSEHLELDYALLGAVLPTPSHPGSLGLGWEKFARLAKNRRLPVFALGGQHLDEAGCLEIAQEHGAHGIAALRNG